MNATVRFACLLSRTHPDLRRRPGPDVAFAAMEAWCARGGSDRVWQAFRRGWRFHNEGSALPRPVIFVSGQEKIRKKLPFQRDTDHSDLT